MSEPLQEIMKVVSNNEEEKKKRENNLIIFIFQDLSIIDRQFHNELISKRNALNVNLKSSDNHYFGIRNNAIARINKIKS
jgi:hypothetical protein